LRSTEEKRFSRERLKPIFRPEKTYIMRIFENKNTTRGRVSDLNALVQPQLFVQWCHQESLIKKREVNKLTRKRGRLGGKFSAP
jgi:hypothetical protein